MKGVGWVIVIFLVVIVGFGFIAVYRGGFLSPPAPPTLSITSPEPSAPADSPSTTAPESAKDTVPAVLLEAEAFTISMSRGTARTYSDVQKEYIEIRASRSNKNAVSITGWQLENRKGERTTILKGTLLAYLSRVNPTRNIFLEPGAKAIIITGESPINTSFRLNLCTGYFNQFNEFTPSLPQQCPYLKNESGLKNVNDACFQYIGRLSRCQMPISIPFETRLAIGNECQDFLLGFASYTGCVNAHRNDSGFFLNEWRVYLGRTEEMWSNVREAIKLFDQNSNLVSEISY